MNRLLSFLLPLGLIFILGLFIYPEANKNYEGFLLGFLAPGVHGACLVPNLIYAQFNPERLIIASTCSTSYTIWWWISAVSGVILYFIVPAYNLFKK